jgi:two-component system, NarL family, nitrate/nitrite response regulator NarL
VNILLIDDHAISRLGIAEMFRQMFPEVSVYEADNFDDGMGIVRTTPLNLVFLDVHMPNKGGLEGLGELKAQFPNLCVVMFSGFDDRELVFESLRLGAKGFIPKSVTRQEFPLALRDVLSGRPYLPASILSGEIRRRSADVERKGFCKPTRPQDLGLTVREFEVLGWVVQGKCNKDIAKRLGIQEQTVRNHLRPIYAKFGVTRRTELLVRIFEQGIVFGPPDVGN